MITPEQLEKSEKQELIIRFAQLVVETGIYKQALEEIVYSESSDEFGIQVATRALIKAREYLNSQGIK